MKFGTWLGLAALVCAAGCSSSGKKTANQGDSKAVSEALTTGITVEHGKKLAGVIPKATATDVDVTQDDAPLMLAPNGGESIMSLDADNPDEDTDPVAAMLMQFDGSDEHFEADVEASGSDAGTADAGTSTGTKHYSVSFTVDDSICKNFCKGSFDGAMLAALKLKKGGITKHLKRPFKLDCTKEGAETCEKDKESTKKDAGSDNGGGGSSADAGGGDTGGNTNTGINNYLSAVRAFSTAGCKCAKSSTTPFCAAGVSMDDFTCIKDALNVDTATSDKWATCAAAVINPKLVTACANACTDPAACAPSVVVTGADGCTYQPSTAVKDALDACMLSTGAAP
jgi:hypothetical protein